MKGVSTTWSTGSSVASRALGLAPGRTGVQWPSPGLRSACWWRVLWVACRFSALLSCERDVYVVSWSTSVRGSLPWRPLDPPRSF